MQVIILCGGLGTRLREETEFRPKPMVKIGDRPILWHIMKTYAAFGHHDFILPLGYKGEMIKEYFWNYELMNSDVTIELGRTDAHCLHKCHDEEGWKITLASTGEDALKGARIKRVQKYVSDDTFMLTYGDGVAAINIDDLLKFHRGHGRAATLTGVLPTARFGELSIQDNRVASFREKPVVSDRGYVSGGFFVFTTRLFDYLDETEAGDLETGALERLAAEGELMVYRHHGFWACMDTLRDVESLNRLWAAGQAPWKIWP
jgi:glucose-1-phosphate cytidylyltransferase